MEWQPQTEKAMSSSSKHCAAESFRVCFTESEQLNSGQHKPLCGDDSTASGGILVPPAWGTMLGPPRTKDLATGALFQCKEGELGPQENIQEEKMVNRAQRHKQLERHSGPHVPHPPIVEIPEPALSWIFHWETSQAAKSSCWIHSR